MQTKREMWKRYLASNGLTERDLSFFDWVQTEYHQIRAAYHIGDITKMV